MGAVGGERAGGRAKTKRPPVGTFVVCANNAN